jgi:hypothetical protein
LILLLYHTLIHSSKYEIITIDLCGSTGSSRPGGC